MMQLSFVPVNYREKLKAFLLPPRARVGNIIVRRFAIRRVVLRRNVHGNYGNQLISRDKPVLVSNNQLRLSS